MFFYNNCLIWLNLAKFPEKFYKQFAPACVIVVLYLINQRLYLLTIGFE